MRLFFAVLLISLSPKLAFADKFRCFGEYTERGRRADLILYGDSQQKEVRTEFLAENGGYSQSLFLISEMKFQEVNELSFSCVRPDGTTAFKVKTMYNQMVGNYTGNVTITRDNQSATYPARCVFLRPM